MKKSTKFPPEVRERAVRLVFECRNEHPSQWAAVVSIAGKMGCTAQTLLSWVRRHERDTGQRQTVADQRQSRGRGQVAVGFFQLETRHDRNG